MAIKIESTQTNALGMGVMEQVGPDKLEPPKNIIASPRALRTIYNLYKKNSISRSLLYAEIEGLIAGNPPWDPAVLAEHGLSHIANFNNLDARAMYDKAALAYWNLLYETDTFLTIVVGTSPEELEFSNIMTEEFDRVIKKWANFRTVINTLIAQIVKFGISVAFWSDEEDWRFDVIELQRFFVANDAPTNTDKLTTICLESNFTAQELFQFYTHAKAKDYKEGKNSTPWDPEELERLLLLRAQNGNASMGRKYDDFMSLQRAYQDGEIDWAETFSDSIRLVSVLQKEYDGKISHYMIDKNGTDVDNKFLYFIDRQYNCLEEVLVLFTASPGEFNIHSNRGVGHKIYAGSQAIMQIDCSIVDMAKFTSTPFLRSAGTVAADAEAIRVYQGTPTHIGNNEFVETRFGANINQLIGASQFLQAKMNYNAANSGDDPSQPDADKGSLAPKQAMIKSYKEFNVLKNGVQHFYTSADYIAENMVAKFLGSKDGCPGYEYAEEWKRRCLKRGVPKEVLEVKKSELSPISRMLPRDWDVRASRVAGDGSTVGMILGLEAMEPIRGSFGPNEALAYKKMFVKALFGKDFVPTFTQDSGSVDDTAAGASLAQVENGFMQQGGQPIVEPTNPHAAHIAVHMALANNVIEQIKQQRMTPVEADKIFTVLAPHLGEHIQIFEQSPFSAAKLNTILPAWRELQGYINFNRKNADAMLQKELRQREALEQKQQGAMSDQERKDFIAQRTEQRKDFQVNATVERANTANETRAEIEKDKIVRESDNQKLDIKLKNENKAREISKAMGANGKSPQTAAMPFSESSITEPLDVESTDNIRDEITRLSGERPARDDFENI